MGAHRTAVAWLRRAVRPIPVDKDALRKKAEELSAKLLEQLKRAPQDRPVRERQVWVQDRMPVHTVQGEDLDAIVVVRAGPAGEPGPYVDSGGFGWHGPSGRPVVIVSLNGHYTPKDLARSLQGSPELIQDMVYKTLLHEVTHASDMRRDEATYKASGAGEQYTTDDLETYYNDPHEVRAHMQEIVDEASSAFGDRQELVFEKFGEARAIKMLLGASDTWREIKDHLHEDNRRKMMQAVHRVVSDRREKTRAKQSEPGEDFWHWMSQTVSRVPNPNPQGRERTISPATLRGYAEAGEHRDRARKIVERYQTQYRARDKEREVAAALLLRTAAYRKEFLDAVKGLKFRNPETGNEVKFVSLPRKEQARIYRGWLDSRGAEVEEDATISAPASPERYEHVEFSMVEEDEKLTRRVMGPGRGSHRDRLLDLAGMGPLAAQVRNVEATVDWDDEGTRIYLNGSGDDGLYFERTIHYSNPPGKRSQSKPDKITNFKIELDADAPEGTGTRMLMGQVLAAEREGFGTIETEAQGSPGSDWSGYYVWPRLGYDGDVEPETLKKMPPDLRREVEKLAKREGTDPRFSHLMMLPEGRGWWRDNGHSVDLEFDARGGSRSRGVLDGYFRERARREGKSPTEYLLRRAAKIDAPRLDDEDDGVLDRLWDEARRRVEGGGRVAAAWMRRVAATQSQLSEFRQEVEGRKFRNPDTGNDVLFVSLPKPEQARIFAEWRRKQRGDEPKPERERGLVEIDREKARDTARRMAEEIGKWKVRAPDEAVGDRFLPGGGGPITYGRMFETSVKGRPRPFPVQLGVGEHGEDLWRAGRHFISGGSVQFRHLGENDEGFPISLRINLNPKLTYRELQDPKATSRIEQEIYSVMVHEMTHARDIVETPAQVRRRKKKDIPERPGPHDSPEESEQKEREHLQGREREYYNRPSEVRAFKRQVAEEFRRTLEKIHKVQEFKRDRAKEKGEEIDDDPDWISMDAESVMTLLERSPTWDRVRHWLTPKNRRKFLETVASVVRTFKEQRGGKVAARRAATLWLRKAISEEYVRPLEKVDTDDLPFDHLFEGKRRMVIDPADYGGLGANEPNSAESIEKFLRENDALKDDEQIDWQRGYVVDEGGKTKSKVGKAFQKAIKNFVGDDRDFYVNMDKVRRGLVKDESPFEHTLGMGRDNILALIGMGHLFVEDFPTDEIWKEIEKLEVPSPASWRRIKEVADKFAELSPDERLAKTEEHEKEYGNAEVSDDYRNQYWAARGLFQTHNKAKPGDDADFLMRHFREWTKRTDDFYASADAEPLRKMHELGSKMDPKRLEDMWDLRVIEKQQQGYDLWRSIRGHDLAVVLSRDPVDVLRMSDYPKAVQAIQSCHSEGGSEFQCAIEEATEGGMIAYVVKKSDVDGRDIDEGELFEDTGREVQGIKPYARLRLRRFETDTGLEVAVPETTLYGADFPDLVKAITDWARKAQPEFVSGDAGYSKRPRDWKLTGGAYQDNASSELFDNFFGRDEDDSYHGEPTEDEYDPYGEGYTLDDSPYYDPDREDEDEGEVEVGQKGVHPWRRTDHMTDFWSWMGENHPRIRNPNPRGTKEYISPATLKGYARGAANYSRNAREVVDRYLSRYQQERSKHAEARARGDVRASTVASAWLLKTAKSSFSEWVKGKRFKNPATGNEVLFSSLPKPEQEKIRASWGQGTEDPDPVKQGPAADPGHSPVHQSAVFGRVMDRRTPEDDQHQGRLASAMQGVSARAEKIERGAKLGSPERKKLYEEGPSILARYIRTGHGLTDEDALKVLATQDRHYGESTELYRGITGVTSEQVEGLLGFLPAEDAPVAVEYTDGRFLQPAQSLASSWSASSKVAHDFAARGVEEGQWNVLFVAQADEEGEHGNFVPVHYDHLGAHDQEQNEEGIYERAFKMALEDDPEALEGFDSWEDILSSDEDTDAARKAVEDNYQYAVEELGMEGDLDNPEGFETEEETLAVGPVRVGRVFVFRKPGDLTRMMREVENEEPDVLTRMAGEDEEDTDKAPKRVKVKKQPFRIDRFVVPADEVFPKKDSPPPPKKS